MTAMRIPIGGTVDRETGAVTIQYRECSKSEREAYIAALLHLELPQPARIETTTEEEGAQ